MYTFSLLQCLALIFTKVKQTLFSLIAPVLQTTDHLFQASTCVYFWACVCFDRNLKPLWLSPGVINPELGLEIWFPLLCLEVNKLWYQYFISIHLLHERDKTIAVSISCAGHQFYCLRNEPAKWMLQISASSLFELNGYLRLDFHTLDSSTTVSTHFT